MGGLITVTTFTENSDTLLTNVYLIRWTLTKSSVYLTSLPLRCVLPVRSSSDSRGGRASSCVTPRHLTDCRLGVLLCNPISSSPCFPSSPSGSLAGFVYWRRGWLGRRGAHTHTHIHNSSSSSSTRTQGPGECLQSTSVCVCVCGLKKGTREVVGKLGFVLPLIQVTSPLVCVRGRDAHLCNLEQLVVVFFPCLLLNSKHTLPARSGVLCERCKALASPSVEALRTNLCTHPLKRRPHSGATATFHLGHVAARLSHIQCSPAATLYDRWRTRVRFFFVFCKGKTRTPRMPLAPSQQQTAPKRIPNSQSYVSPLSFCSVHSKNCGRVGSVFLRFLQVEN